MPVALRAPAVGYLKRQGIRMPELLGMIVGEAVGLLLWSFLNASILQWRARKLMELFEKKIQAGLVEI